MAQTPFLQSDPNAWCREEWRDPHTGLPCRIIRNEAFKCWCLYVGVLPGHAWHGVEIEDIDAGEFETYIDFSGDMHDATGNVWWFGFDARPQDGPYDTMRDQCAEVAKHLAAGKLPCY